MKHNRNPSIIRPMIAGLAVVGLSFGAAACSDDDGNESDIDNPVDGVDDQLDDGLEDLDDDIDGDLEDEIDSETDTTDG